jgi:hypothetical protein
MGKLDLFKSIWDDNRMSGRRTNTGTFMFNVLGYDKEGDTIENAHCQRALCWGDEQYRAYVTHTLETKQAGSFILYRPHPYDVDYVLDGQHRREAWLRFINGDLYVEKNNERIFWNDFNDAEKRDLKMGIRCSIDLIEPRARTPYDESLAEDIYNKFNFTGIKH